MVEERDTAQYQAQLDELQQFVDGVARRFPAKSRKVVFESALPNGAPFKIKRHLVIITRAWFEEPQMPFFHFALAHKFALEAVETRDIRRICAEVIVLFIATTLIALVLALNVFAGMAWETPLKVVAGLLLLVGSAWHFVWTPINGERWLNRVMSDPAFLVPILKETGDTERLRSRLEANNATPEQYAKFDALVRDMKLESPKPTEG